MAQTINAERYLKLKLPERTEMSSTNVNVIHRSFCHSIWNTTMSEFLTWYAYFRCYRRIPQYHFFRTPCMYMVVVMSFLMGICRYYFSKRDEILMGTHKLASLNSMWNGSRSVRRHASSIESRRTVGDSSVPIRPAVQTSRQSQNLLCRKLQPESESFPF